jgi:hypothetical protein
VIFLAMAVCFSVCFSNLHEMRIFDGIAQSNDGQESNYSSHVDWKADESRDQNAVVEKLFTIFANTNHMMKKKDSPIHLLVSY